MSRMKIVLVTPEIPGNTGTIGRTCVALDMELVLIHPLGFDLSEKSVRRAGLDYWQHVRLSQYADWDTFITDREPARDEMFLFENQGKESFYAPDYPDQAYLIFGKETKGLPEPLVAAYAERLFYLPMRSPHIRSLNLANAVSAVAYQAIRKQFF
ncbi:MAG: tRNA (cytidine(34)-2'-O)-methyltransferase [Pseudomonadota bacterium]